VNLILKTKKVNIHKHV